MIREGGGGSKAYGEIADDVDVASPRRLRPPLAGDGAVQTVEEAIDQPRGEGKACVGEGGEEGDGEADEEGCVGDCIGGDGGRD